MSEQATSIPVIPDNSTPTEPVSVATETPKPELADTFARIAKQESFVKAERAKIDEARKAFEADKEAITHYKSLKGKDPFEILEHFGISYDKLLEADKNRRSPVDPLVKKALEAVEQLKGELHSEKEKVTQERRSKAEVQLQTSIAEAIKTHEFDLIEKLEAHSDVREYMEEMYATTGEIPDVKQACEAVTEKLVAKFTKVKDSKWLVPKDVVASKEESSQETKPQTLSNKMTQSSVGTDKPMSEAERMKAAIAALNSK